MIAQESYPNVDRHSFHKITLTYSTIKTSIHHLKQLDDMIQLAQQLDYFENIHSIPGIGKLHMIIGRLY